MEKQGSIVENVALRNLKFKLKTKPKSNVNKLSPFWVIILIILNRIRKVDQVESCDHLRENKGPRIWRFMI